MASWRKNLPVLPESLREEESDGFYFFINNITNIKYIQ